MTAWRTTSSLAKLTLLFYMMAVGLGFVDQALYGPDDHSHHGQPCQAHHFTSLNDAVSLPGAAVPAAPAVAVAVHYKDVVAQLTAAHFLSYKSRDPPARLFS